MVKNAITVFARVKPEARRKSVANYEIHRRPKEHLDEDFLVLTAPRKSTEYIDNRPETWNFSFHRIFGHDVPQDDIFESVARPIVDSVFNGYNATIFAYGQTGSGKTYTITGDPEIHSEQGILPRTLQYVFDIVRKNPENLYTVEVAYLEIYNENGYDLLLERKEREAATRLEDLPRVTIQEDESGTMHLKNLSFRIIQNEKEAIQFLLDGDTYRAISETPMNPRSSRSHCIFTIVVSVKKFGEERYTRAKMHLVDLAGSERVYKCAIQGTILTEAKHINLSLHFLEQVIVCLGQDNVSHVPYRNSLLTSILRDSLGGNCLTTMLATLSVSNFNLEETISTCRFAQRVALVKNDVNLSFELDIKSENILLKLENERLRKQIEEIKKQSLPDVSGSGSVEYYKDLVIQRDQEISHLIDLLKKERSRRKSAIKEVPKATKEVLQCEKYTQFPSSCSPRNIHQTSPTESKTKRKNAISSQGQIQTKHKNKKQSLEIPRTIISLSESTGLQFPAIEVPALNLEEENDSNVRLDQPQVESKTSKIDNVSITTVTRTKDDEIKRSAERLTDRNIQTPKAIDMNTIDDNQLLKVELQLPTGGQKMPDIDNSIAEINHNRNKRSQSIESSKVMMEREHKTPKTAKCYTKIVDNNEFMKKEGTKKLVDQEIYKISNNLPGSDDRTEKCQTSESTKCNTERDNQTSKKVLSCSKDTENNESMKAGEIKKLVDQEIYEINKYRPGSDDRTEKCQTSESSKSNTERDNQTSKKGLSCSKDAKNNESMKAEGIKKLVDQEIYKINNNRPGRDDRTEQCQTSESSKSKTERDNQTPSKVFCSSSKVVENNGSGIIRPKESSSEALLEEFPQNVMKMLRTSCNRLTEKRDESTLPAVKPESPRSGFKIPNNLRNTFECLEKNSTGGSVGSAEDKRLSNPTKNNRDAVIDNIVRIPLPLTGDPDIDEEIIAFYRAKQTGNLY